MQDSFVFLILGVGRLREDQLIYVETRENLFFQNMGPLKYLVLSPRTHTAGKHPDVCHACWNSVLNCSHWLGSSLANMQPHHYPPQVSTYTCKVNMIWHVLQKCYNGAYHTYKFEYICGLQQSLSAKNFILVTSHRLAHILINQATSSLSFEHDCWLSMHISTVLWLSVDRSPKVGLFLTTCHLFLFLQLWPKQPEAKVFQKSLTDLFVSQVRDLARQTTFVLRAARARPVR